MRFEVRTTAGLCSAALIVPISGIVIWKSESTSSRKASNSSSARSISSISSTTCSGLSTASSSGRPDQELGPEQLLLAHRPFLRGADVQELARVVPLVDGVRDVEALVALEADQPRAEHAGERLGRLGLPDARLALEQHRLLERERRGRAPSRGPGPGGSRRRRERLRARRSRSRPQAQSTPHGRSGPWLAATPRQARRRARSGGSLRLPEMGEMDRVTLSRDGREPVSVTG